MLFLDRHLEIFLFPFLRGGGGESAVCNEGKSRDARMLITIDKIIDITDDSSSVIRAFLGGLRKLKTRIFRNVYVP